MLATLGILIVTARWSGWWGGWSYGYRLVVDTAVLLAFLAIPVAEKIRERRSLTLLVGVLLAWSVGVQALGALTYDVAGWNGREGYALAQSKDGPRQPYFTTAQKADDYCRTRGCSYGPVVMNVDSSRFNDRLWSIRDSQILYYLQNAGRSMRRRFSFMRRFLLGDF